MPGSLSNGDVKWVVGLVNLELRIYVWAEQRDLKLVDKKRLFKAMRIYEDPGKSVYGRNGKGPRLISEEGPIRTKRGD